jgi:RNA polymerase sigma-70 factor (ECF subfamily)
MSGSRTDPIEDARLVAELVAGSEDALATLYDRHAGAVHGTAFRLTSDRALAEDIVQETFLALWNRAEQFDPDRGSLAAWLLTIARNRTVDRLRAAGRRPTVVPISAAGMADETQAATLERIARVGVVVGGARAGPGPEAELARAELRQTIDAALDAMAEPEREVLLLAYRDELSQSEIAIRLGWPLGTVKTRTRRALLRLRLVLGPELGPLPLDGVAHDPEARAAGVVQAAVRADR